MVRNAPFECQTQVFVCKVRAWFSARRQHTELDSTYTRVLSLEGVDPGYELGVVVDNEALIEGPGGGALLEHLGGERNGECPLDVRELAATVDLRGGCAP